MQREYTSNGLPHRLLERLEASRDESRFRRRAVLANGNGRWELVCCTVEGLLLGEAVPLPIRPHRYPQALLYEDVLTGDECLSFAHALHGGRARIGDIDLEHSQNPQWTTELLPVTNDYMARAGYLTSVRFSQHGTRASGNTLLSPDQPYYPNVDEAARDWLPFRVYHGHSDARNEQIHFLLPETRAYINAGTVYDFSPRRSILSSRPG